jgi:hypothetical protein
VLRPRRLTRSHRGRSRVTDHRPGTYELPCPLQGQVSTRTRTETPFAELPERSLQRPLNRGAPTTLSANSRRRPTAGKPLGHGSTRASVGRSASGADSFGVVTERSAVRVSDPPPLSGIDLVRASRITLSPNSNLLPKSYLRLRLPTAERDPPTRQPGRGYFSSSIPDLERSARFRLRSL